MCRYIERYGNRLKKVFSSSDLIEPNIRRIGFSCNRSPPESLIEEPLSMHRELQRYVYGMMYYICCIFFIRIGRILWKTECLMRRKLRFFSHSIHRRWRRLPLLYRINSSLCSVRIYILCFRIFFYSLSDATIGARHRSKGRLNKKKNNNKNNAYIHLENIVPKVAVYTRYC